MSSRYITMLAVAAVTYAFMAVAKSYTNVPERRKQHVPQKGNMPIKEKKEQKLKDNDNEDKHNVVGRYTFKFNKNEDDDSHDMKANAMLDNVNDMESEIINYNHNVVIDEDDESDYSFSLQSGTPRDLPSDWEG
eukprot:722979_1